MKHKLVLVVANTLTLMLTLFVNYAGSTGIFLNHTVADVSYKYDTLFAPAGYAFAIWGFLFLLQICFVIFQWTLLKTGDPGNHISRTGIWFSLSNLANAAWVYCWTNEWLGLSVVCIFLLLLFLINMVKNLRLELDDEPVRISFFVWFPIVFYLGWIMVATIACVAAWLVYTGWNHPLEDDTWTIILTGIATLLYLLLIIKRNMREAALVGTWAFIAIAVRQWNSHHTIALAAIIASVILFSANSWHAYKNRKYNLGLKIKKHEW